LKSPFAKLGRTSVARRLFVVFVLSAFLPLAAIALLSLVQVRDLLLQQGDLRLSASAKSYGMTLFERSLLAADLATAVGSSGAPALSPDSLVPKTFRSLAVFSGGNVRLLLGGLQAPVLNEEARERLATGKPVVIVTEDAHVLLFAPFTARGGGFAGGELWPDFIWGPAEELPALTDFCILQDVSHLPLHCSSAVGEDAVSSIGSTLEGTLGAGSWKRGDERYRARWWTQFMRAGLGTPDWIVIASQPEGRQLVRAVEFQQHYIPVVLLAVVLVIWLTIRQSRNIVEPVQQLAERARGIAKSDFSTRLDLKREDEFGELGGAFDQMSDRLGRQFASLTALSEIDRLILATEDTTQITRTVLHRMDQLLSADTVSVTLFENDSPGNARTYFRPQAARDTMSMERHNASEPERQELSSNPAGLAVAIDTLAALPAYLAPLRNEGMAKAFVQPILWRGAVCGALSLGYRDRAHAILQDDRQQARELADRVAVAVSSAWRDEQLYRQAHFDTLTLLPNRSLFNDRLEREIARSQREGLSFALLFVDLDHFKNVNDSFGHGTGDEVLREASRRIAACLRETDTVARLGGDEFTVIATRLGHPQEAWLISESIVESLSREFRLGERQAFLSASIGIASYPADGNTAEALLRAADTAMYRAKSGGRAQAVFFEERMNAEALARVTLDRDLRAAIERGELTLHYQPQYDLRTGAIRGAEALVRWQHPVHGLISPARFIPLAEESGFIEHIGRWTLERACAQMRDWRAEGLPLETVSVNVSPRQFRKRSLIDFIRRCTSEAGLPPACLDIEITEGLLLDRVEAVENLLHEIAAAGHGIALDDFGTGFSSMSYLKRLPVTIIKIDRVFVDGLDKSADAEAIVAAIIAMTHALGKTVIAEGVETTGQLAALKRLGCDQIQGFHISPALPPAEFVALLRARLGVPA
jgi:diguanylate cyclase (GGDEF)-like protein